MNILPELFKMQRVYHKAIYDCFNEAISFPQMLPEEGFIQRVIFRVQKPRRELTEDRIDDILLHCKEIVLEWSSLLCGIIRDKEDSMMGNIKFMEPELINQLREERLFRFLSLEVILFKKGN